VFRLLLHRQRRGRGRTALAFRAKAIPLWPKAGPGFGRHQRQRATLPRHGLEVAQTLNCQTGIHHIHHTHSHEPDRAMRVPKQRRLDRLRDSRALLDFTAFKGEYASLGSQYTIQSLTKAAIGEQAVRRQTIGSAPPSTSPYHRHCLRLVNTSSSYDDTHGIWPQLFTAVLLPGRCDQPWPEPILLSGHRGIGSDFYGICGQWHLGSTNCLIVATHSTSHHTFQRQPIVLGPSAPSASLWVARSRNRPTMVWLRIGAAISRHVRSKTLPAHVFLTPPTFSHHPSLQIEGLCTTILQPPLLRSRLTIVFLTNASACLPGW